MRVPNEVQNHISNFAIVMPVHSNAKEGQDIQGGPTVNADVDAAQDTLLRYYLHCSKISAYSKAYLEMYDDLVLAVSMDDM